MTDYSKYYEDDPRRKGAGGSEGGIGRFFLGMVMMIGGIYLLLTNIYVGGFGMGGAFGGQFNFGGRQITSGFVMIPFMFGVGMIFFNQKNYLGWFLTLGSLIMLIFGVITSAQFHFRNLNAFELITILILMVGGLGFLLSSMRSVKGKF